MVQLLSVSALVEGKKEGVSSFPGSQCSAVQGQASSPRAKIGMSFQIHTSDLGLALMISWNPFHYLFAVCQILLIHAYFSESLGTLKVCIGNYFSSKHTPCLKLPGRAHPPSNVAPVTSGWWGHSVGTRCCGRCKPPGWSEMPEPYAWWWAMGRIKINTSVWTWRWIYLPFHLHLHSDC